MAMGIHSSASRRRRGGGARAPMAEINVTPLVDVMLVLLIIFMVTAPLLKAAVPIELPQSRAKALAEQAGQIDVTIDGSGAIFFDGQPLPAGGLAAKLATLQPDSDGKMPLVTLRADKSLDYQTVLSTMGELNRGGITSISLVSDVSGGSGT